MNHNPNTLLRTQDLPPIYEENSCMYASLHAYSLRARAVLCVAATLAAEMMAQVRLHAGVSGHTEASHRHASYHARHG